MGKKVSKIDRILDRLDKIDSRLAGLTKDVQNLNENMASLTCTVDRIDTRLIEVEKHTAIIPGMNELLLAHSTDLDDHEKRLKKLEKPFRAASGTV